MGKRKIDSVEKVGKPKKAKTNRFTQGWTEAKKEQIKKFVSISENWNLWFENPNYWLWKLGNTSETVDVVGIDIGWKHLGISGILLDKDGTYERTTRMSLLKSTKSTMNERLDELVQILRLDPNFEWFRTSTRYHIEIQVGPNSKARIQFNTFRLLIQTLSRLGWNSSKLYPVKGVSSKAKYKVLPQFCTRKNIQDPNENLRTDKINPNDRKNLAIWDILFLLEKNGEQDAYMAFAANLLKRVEDFKMDDVADSILLAIHDSA